MPTSFGPINLLATLFLLALTTNVQGASSDRLPLEFSIRVEKHVYYAGQSINIHCTIKNHSKSPVTINGRFRFPGPEVYLRVTDQNGRKAQWLAPEPPPPLTKDDFLSLPPSGSIGFTLRDVQLYLHHDLSIGRYSVQSLYKNSSGQEVGVNAWIGSISSNVETFAVIEKTGMW
jgi:hypothetical protein